jgi:hypothetical protein
MKWKAMKRHENKQNGIDEKIGLNFFKKNGLNVFFSL